MPSNDPVRVFPPEVIELREKQGVPLPTWFSGPLYTGNGGDEAKKAVVEQRERAQAPLKFEASPKPKP
jgi:hypothetical protein